MSEEPNREEAAAPAKLALKRVALFFVVLFVVVTLAATGWFGLAVQDMTLDGLGLTRRGAP